MAVASTSEGSRWLVRPRPWSFGVTLALLFGALGLVWQNQRLAATAAMLSAIAWLLYGAMPVADRHSVGRIGWLTALATLAVTWTTAMLAAVLYAAFVAHETSAQVWIPIMLLAATNVGGLLAVFRSSQTRTETRAALHEISDLRIAVLSAPVIEAADRASRARTFEELTASFSSMLQLAVSLSLLPRAVDRASLWALDEAHAEWFICAATTPQRDQFRQRVVTTATAGAGIVANLAAGSAPPPLVNSVLQDDVYLISDDLHRHPWYRVNPERDRPAEGMAVVLLRRDRRPVGALCFTWDSAVPTTGHRAQELIDILQRWAQAFGIGLSRLYRLGAELKQP